MFGGGSPVFAQMPVYTPVTRSPDIRPQPAEPPQPAYSPYAQIQPAPAHLSQQAASGLSYPTPQAPSPLAYPSPQPGAAPSYQSPHPSAGNYQSAHRATQPNYPNLQTTEFSPQAYQPASQPVQAPSFAGAEHAGLQAYPASSYNSAQGFPAQSYGNQSFADASFPGSGTGDASFPETSFDQNFADANFGAQDLAKQNFGDASFPETQGFDASFPESSFSATQQGQDSFAQPESQADQSFEAFAEDSSQDYSMSSQVPPSDPRRQLQAFDALYDQPPQISLGSHDQTRRAAQEFYEGERLDADFLDEGQVLPPPGARAKVAIRGRSAFMVGSALLGAIALGGALAFAYKQSGGGLSGEQPPLVTADNRPVKELPDQPGGKEFPNKNKLIYDRLQNGDEPESERIVPRQENVAVPALPPSTETAGTPTPIASTDLNTPPTTQAVSGGEPVAVASVDDGSMPDGGPRRVKTARVLPDGSVEEPPMPAASSAENPTSAAPGGPAAEPQLAAAAPQVAAPEPQAAAAAPQAATPQAPEAIPQQVAALPTPPAPEPKPAAKPAPQQTAAATPAAAPTKYVVQVASKKNQTEALASFADMQQKYPSLLANYRPIVQKADLGAKGTWYRLRIGPIADKSAASKLCSQLKSQGLPDCLVMAAQ
jgi:cell division septation protein DedD